MNKKILCFSQVQIEALSGSIGKPHIIISITDPNYPDAKIEENSNRLGVLFLKFWDIKKELNHLKKGLIKPIAYEQAKEILDFVHKFLDKVDLILINCQGGVSRSPAVALTLEKIINSRDLQYMGDYILANKYVYNKIMEVAKDNGLYY